MRHLNTEQTRRVNGKPLMDWLMSWRVFWTDRWTPLGIYHAIWDQNQWTPLSLIYLISGWITIQLATGPRPLYLSRSSIGNQPVLTFGDDQQTRTAACSQWSMMNEHTAWSRAYSPTEILSSILFQHRICRPLANLDSDPTSIRI
jgi:hypothetical protein